MSGSYSQSHSNSNEQSSVSSPNPSTIAINSNPIVIGFFGSGISMLLWNFANIGALNEDAAVIGLGASYGGIAQFIVGILELIKGETIAATIFISFGSFWISQMFIPFFSSINWKCTYDHTSIGIYFILWTLFSFCICLICLSSSFLEKFYFILLTVFYLILSIGHLTDNTTVIKVSGYFGLVVGFLSFYNGLVHSLGLHRKKILVTYE